MKPAGSCTNWRIRCHLGLLLLLALVQNRLLAQSNADLSLSFANAPVAASVGQYFRFTISIFNNGPDAATNAIISDLVPANATFIGAFSSQGSVSYTNGQVVCNAGLVPFYRTASMTIELMVPLIGQITNSATVSSDTPDSTPTNNTATFTTTVTQARFFGVGSAHALYYSNPSMTLLPNNQVLIVGHHLGKTSDLYDIATRSLSVPAGTMVGTHENGSATLLNNGLVLLAGGGNGTAAKTAELYNPATQAFQQVGDMLVYSYGHYASIQPDGTVLLCGGALSTNELFNPASGTFSLAPTKQCPFNGIYLPTGKFLYFGYGRAYLFDTNSSTSVETSGFLQPRAYQSATLLPNGKVLLIGGQGTWGATSDSLTSSELYDPVTDSFTWTANMNTRREFHSACLLPDGTVLVAGGMVSQSDPFSLTYAEIYDPNGIVNVPGVGVSDASALEGDTGTNYMNFNLWLTGPPAQPVTVRYTISGGSASSQANGVGTPDFVPITGTITFPVGTTNQILPVPILGDRVLEPAETLYVNLSQPTQAWMARSIAQGTILNDDATPTLALSPVTSFVTERDSGVVNLVYNVTLSAPSFDTVTVDYFTSDETAQAGSDYIPIAGTLEYQPGETNKVLVVQSIGDLQLEPDETFSLHLTNAHFALIDVAQATGTILNDDGFAGGIHHFDIAPITGVKTQSFAFPVSITARDGFGNVATNFSNPVRIVTSSTNVGATNLDFELPVLAPWAPLTNGDNPGPYELIPYDMRGDGRLSTVFRMRINPGTDGIFQNVQLTGGITYTLSVDLVSAQEGGGCWVGAQAALGIGNSNGYWNMPDLCGGQSAAGRIEVPFTAPSNGVYALALTVSYGAPWYIIPNDYFLYADNVQIAFPALTPTLLTNAFTNGVWTGSLTALQGATNVVLIADDAQGHKGFSNPIDIQPIADLAMTASSLVQGSPPLRTGMKLQFNLSVTNRGPSTSANTLLHCDLPANLIFLTATNQLGTISNYPGAIDWFIGSVPPGSNLTATIVCRADIPGDFTNLFTLQSSMLDLNTADNSVALSNRIDPPLVSIAGASGVESPSSATGIVFTVTSSGPSGQPLFIDYFTSDGSATNGIDYIATNGTITIAAGFTNATIKVFPIDNILNQAFRTFSVNLTNPVNSALSVSNAIGTIIDDDLPPVVWIYDTSVLEGDSGTRNANFPLTLSKPAVYDVTINYRTLDGTAVSPNDYVAQNSTVTFPAGSTNAFIAVAVNGNTVNESNETFLVNLTAASNATLGTNQAVGTILNDDAVAGRLDHFGWDLIPSPRYKDWPFGVILRALDYQNNPATNGVGSATVTARTDNGFLRRLLDDFEDGDAAGWTNSNGTFSAIVTNETANGGIYSLRLTGGTANTATGFRRGISNSQPNKVSFAVRASRTNQVAGRFTTVANGLYRSAVFYFNNNGQMGLIDRQLGFRGVPYQSNRWYRVDLTMNWAAQKVDCRIDGALVLTNITFPDTITSMDSVLLANQDNTTSWWDDVSVLNDNLTNTFTINPATFTSFVNGAKSNLLTITGVGTNVYLSADDGQQHIGRSGFFDLLPVNLSLITPGSVSEGSAPVAAQVVIPVSFAQAITVALTSTVPSELTVPPSVIIPPNQTNASFNLTIIDDALLDGPQPVPVIASATNFVSTTNVVTVQDNEPAVLTLTIPAGAAENAGILSGQGHITSSAVPAKSVTVTLASSDTNVVKVPASVIIQSNQTSASFDLQIINNQRLDGSHSATITASVVNWTGDSKSIVVTDDDPAILRISGPGQLNESATNIPYVAFVPGTLDTNLTINLSSSDTNDLAVSPSIILSAGQTSVVFNVSVPDNALFDGSRLATLSASAPGFTPASTNVTVTDNDLHHFSFSAISSPQQGNVGFSLTITARDTNNLLMAAYSTTVPLTAVDGSGNTVPLTPSNVTFANGQWSGTVTLTAWEFQNVRIFATDSGSRSNSSTLFDLVAPTVSIVSVSAGDLAYSERSKLLYASVTNTGSLLPVDPFNLAVGQPIPVPGLSGRICASDEGRYLFAALNGATNHICQVDVDLPSLINAWPLDGTYVEDMAPVAGSPESIAVSRKALGTSPRFRGVVVYDNAVARSNSNNGFLGSNVIEPGRAPGRIYGYNSETSPAGFQIMNVDASGITVVGGWGGVPPFAGEIFCRGGWIFSTWGAVYDPERGIQVASYGGQVADDAASARYYLVSAGTIAAYDENTLLPVGATALPGVTGVAGSVVRWGSNGIAFRMNASKCAIVRTPLISTGTGADLRLTANMPSFPVPVGSTLTFTLGVTNLGAVTAKQVVLTETLPANSSFISATTSSGTAGPSGGGIVAYLGQIPAGGSAIVTVSLQTLKPGLLASIASVTSDSLDPTLSNNVLHLEVPVGKTAAQDSITEVELNSTDLVWDKTSQRLFATVPNSDWLLGNCVLGLDPLSGGIDPRIPTAIEPAKIAVADNGAYLYTGINSDASIQRINIPSRTVDLKFPTGLNYVADMAVLPGTAEAVAVTAHTTFAVYDHGVMRPNTVAPGAYNFEYYLAISGTNTLAYEAPPGELRRIAIDASGATLVESSGLINGFDRSIKFDSGRLYTAGGRIIDPEAGVVVTNLPYSGLVCPDANSGKVFYLTVSAGIGILHAVNVTNFVEAGSITISNVQGTASSLIRWGLDGLAFRTSAGQVFLLRTIFADDRNTNGLPDTWELQYFNSLNAPNNGPNDDPDGDGFTNLQEYRAGISPIHYDALRFIKAQMNAGAGFQLSVLGNLGNSYALLASADLSHWTPILKFTCTNVPMVITDPESGQFDHRYYRIAPLSAVSGPSLRLSAGLNSGQGQLTLMLDGVPGFSYRIESSTNLVNWLPLTNLVSTNQTMYLQDTANSARMFYRAVVQ